LRPGVRFHDGAPSDAAAVAANLRRVARPDMGVTLGAPGVYAQYLFGAEIVARDAETLEVALARPMADLPAEPLRQTRDAMVRTKNLATPSKRRGASQNFAFQTSGQAGNGP
jgi:ABC-type transport system substrate-binding protein